VRRLLREDGLIVAIVAVYASVVLFKAPEAARPGQLARAV